MSDRDPRELVAWLRALEAEATPPEWSTYKSKNGWHLMLPLSKERDRVWESVLDNPNGEADQTFIAALRNAFADLAQALTDALDRAERAEAVVEARARVCQWEPYPDLGVITFWQGCGKDAPGVTVAVRMVLDALAAYDEGEP